MTASVCCQLSEIQINLRPSNEKMTREILEIVGDNIDLSRILSVIKINSRIPRVKKLQDLVRVQYL